MRIDPRRCVACGNCIPVCPMGVIYIDPSRNRAVINEEECVECFTCYRGMSTEELNPTLVRAIRAFLRFFRLRFDPEPDVCPTAAIVPEELQWPRVVRWAFSDPVVTHESTGIHGRGTEEVKTNDVTDRIKEGEAGFVVEFGRPAIGVRFRDIQRMTVALAGLGVDFEKKNPVTFLMEDSKKGTIRSDILNEKVLSAIVELKTPLEMVPRVLETIQEVSRNIDTVVSVGVSSKCDEKGYTPLEDFLKEKGYPFYWAKTNLGLGRRVP